MKSITFVLVSLFAVLSAQAQRQSATLLTDAPEGWRFERLDFPLRFAPDLGIEGYEEIRFAPGMFDPNSDSYFSYAMAMLIKDQKQIDAAFVQDLFQKYFIGLCRSVGQSRKLNLDLSRISTQVKEQGREFQVTVSMYDAFVTGEPLLLNMRVSLHHGESAAGVVLLGLASPAKPDAAIWKELNKIRGTFTDDQPELRVTLNHFFVIPDQETFDAIAASEFLKNEFATFEERTTVRRDMTYTGIYFYGRNTYFEFLPPGGGGMPVGASGIAFGLETAGETQTLHEIFKSKEIQCFPGSITRQLDDRQIPWFRSLGIQQAHTESSFSMFTMEYENEFLKRWHADLAPQQKGITRNLVLQRYAQHVLGEKAADEFLFEDVIEIELKLDARERQRFESTLEAFGYLIKKSGNRSVATGPEIRFVVTESELPGGIVGFQVKLVKSRQYLQPFRLGNSQLEIDGNTGKWTFGAMR